jgi:hypothetical protein
LHRGNLFRALALESIRANIEANGREIFQEESRVKPAGTLVTRFASENPSGPLKRGGGEEALATVETEKPGAGGSCCGIRCERWKRL